MEDEYWRRIADENAGQLSQRGKRNLAALLVAAGVPTLHTLPPRQASAIAWLAAWESDLVAAVINALADRAGTDISEEEREEMRGLLGGRDV